MGRFLALRGWVGGDEAREGGKPEGNLRGDGLGAGGPPVDRVVWPPETLGQLALAPAKGGEVVFEGLGGHSRRYIPSTHHARANMQIQKTVMVQATVTA
jgi:hypothetical protein